MGGSSWNKSYDTAGKNFTELGIIGDRSISGVELARERCN